MLSIIIVNYKTPESLRACVASLNETIRKTEYEIIVVDVASDGSAAAALAQWKKEINPVRNSHETFLSSRELFKATTRAVEQRDIISNGINLIDFTENTGYAKAVNSGLRAARGEYYLILNADMEAPAGAVDEMIGFMLENVIRENIGLIGPRLLGLDSKVQQSAFRFYTPLTILLRRTFLGRLPWWRSHIDYFLMKDKNVNSTDQPQPVDWLMGTALLTSKEAVRKVGGMDERFFMYFEDVDWARRFWENGYKVFYYPKATMRHAHGRASRKGGMAGILFNQTTRAHIKSGLLYLIKYRFKTTHYV